MYGRDWRLKRPDRDADTEGMHPASDEGFSLVELVVVLGIMAILIAVALPTLMGPKRIAQDAAAQAQLVTALKTEEIFATDADTYSSDVAVLESLEPSLDWSGTNDSAIHLPLASVVGTNDSILLYARSTSGTWFGLRHVRAGARAGRYQCSGASRDEVDDMTDCVGHDW